MSNLPEGRPVAVVTGANRGIGLAVASNLAAGGMRVVMVVRDAHRSAEAVRAIRDKGGDVVLVVGDVGSVRTAKDLAGALREACPRIDVLVHNAGLWPSRLERNEDGVERAFAVNHVGPFVLNLALEPLLVASRTHVVQVTAGLYGKGRVDLEKTPRGDDFHAIRTYATTKLCNLLCMPLFAERWKDRGPTIDAVHPGVIRTGLGDRPGALGRVLRAVKWLWKTPEEGARPIVRLAREPLDPGERTRETGRYFEVDVEKALLPVARDAALARALWDQTLVLAGMKDAGRDAA